jgi:uncharacterized protein
MMDRMDFDRLTVVLLNRHPDAPARSEAEAGALQAAHMAFLADLHDAGHLLAAGPVLDPGSPVRGFSLFRGDPEEALRVASTDPAVRAGEYTLTALPWMTPTGALDFRHTRYPRSMADVRGPDGS